MEVGYFFSLRPFCAASPTNLKKKPYVEILLQVQVVLELWSLLTWQIIHINKENIKFLLSGPCLLCTSVCSCQSGVQHAGCWELTDLERFWFFHLAVHMLQRERAGNSFPWSVYGWNILIAAHVKHLLYILLKLVQVMFTPILSNAHCSFNTYHQRPWKTGVLPGPEYGEAQM